MSSAYAFQKTVVCSGRLSGIGLHTGKPCSFSVRPAKPDQGIKFFRNGKLVSDLKNEKPSTSSSESLRCSSVGRGENEILTVEHFLATLLGLGITNLEVEVEGPEMPGMDGSAVPFVHFFKELKLVEQTKRVDFYKIKEPIFCYDKLKSVCIYPADEFGVSYVLDYEHPFLRNQKVDFVLTPEIFEKEIAPARTFCTDKEAEQLRVHGFGLGATEENTLVIREDGAHSKRLRFPDECARHKVLDILGDFMLLGFPVMGRVAAIRGGHKLNQKLAQAIQAQKGDGGQVMNIEEIKKVLPHRYPFLLVDKIVEVSERRIVGIKNVTANEPFFQGHFPERPVMPGVLMVEALAQVGGVLMLSKKENHGKIAYLVAIKEARFRRVVVPGDQLRLEVDIVKFKARVGIVTGVAKVGNEVACEAEIMFSLAD